MTTDFLNSTSRQVGTNCVGSVAKETRVFPSISQLPSIINMVTKRDFLEMEASLRLNGRSQNVWGFDFGKRP